MNLMNKIPREFYKLFASKYMDYYQQFLTAIRRIRQVIFTAWSDGGRVPCCDE